ncbi:MAG: metallophosphoesterase family protein [Bacteroidales bacterium]
MKSIGLLSDTHGFVHPSLRDFLKKTDEIWHAGDIGSYDIIADIRQDKPFRAVYGNIDDMDIRNEFPEYQSFWIEGVKVIMLHIGGYPYHYSQKAKALINNHQPNLFISGHSHILKAMFDKKYKMLHLNPGAAGKQGFHQYITFMRFEIDNKRIKNLEIAEHPRK